MDKMDDLILLHFQKIPLSGIEYIHSYVPSQMHKEPDPSLILRFLKFRFPHAHIVSPRIKADDLSMVHYKIEEGHLYEKNEFGIDEPAVGEEVRAEDIDLILIPLLAFDTAGNRVGFGKGYYDRFLSECRDDAIKVGLSFFDPVERIDDTNEYDIPLNFCCTPEELFSWQTQ